MGELRHGRTCVFNINYHIVWSTKYRRKVLNTDIERRLKEILIDVGKQKGFEIAEIEVGTKDHVHVFVSAIPKISISYIAKMMKGISGRLLLKEFPEISRVMESFLLCRNNWFYIRRSDKTIYSKPRKGIICY